MDSYAERWIAYRKDPMKYWENYALLFKWFKPWNSVCDDSDPIFPKWFSGGELNLCYDVLDRQVEENRGNDVISVFDSLYTEESRSITYNELLSEVSKLAGVFHDDCDIHLGDRVLIYMPMVPEALFGALASCRLGAVYYVLMGSYSEQAIAERIDDFQPKLVIVASTEFEDRQPINMKNKLDEAINLATHKPFKCLVFQRKGLEATQMDDTRDIDLYKAMGNARPHGYVPVEANSPLFTIYTSGTTGKPKGIIHSIRAMAIGMVQNGSFILGDYGDAMVYIISSYGWIVGQLMMIYMSLYWNRPCLIHEGPVMNPNARDVYRLISKYEVKVFFFPTAAQRVVINQDPDGLIAKDYQPFHVRKLYAGGCSGDSQTFNWALNVIGSPVMQIYGTTETVALTTFDTDNGKKDEDQPLMSSGKPIPGTLLEVLNYEGTPAAVEEPGRLAIKFPLPPTMMSTIFGNKEKYESNYLSNFPGYFDIKDEGKFDKDGYLHILSRSDDVFKVLGHRISCSGVEEAILSHPEVAECAVVTKSGIMDGVLTNIPVGFFVTKRGTIKSLDTVAEELVTLVHNKVGNFVPFEKPKYMESFPRTSTGKLARGVLCDIARSM